MSSREFAWLARSEGARRQQRKREWEYPSPVRTLENYRGDTTQVTIQEFGQALRLACKVAQGPMKCKLQGAGA